MSMMLEVLREFGGISFIFDFKEGEVFLGAIGDLKDGKKIEIVANDRSTGGVVHYTFVEGVDDGFKNKKHGAEIILSAESREYAGYKLEELRAKGGFSTPEFVQLSNLKSTGKVVDTFFVLRK
ncbi:hypothetical protein KDX15_28800 [Burkholderia cenocepacia]|uniref:hypothetical protein n=1 Tax=Burkholderia cenocepacia TaxID=95486 RepID=UPI00158DF6A7|nr:hypothetical protein [Burkholderia cenocepacia]MBR8277848.1 hypothetical protein [Burkholderia cenocepacia]MBR8414758.1 hypothetical protein [Burkholderia cenocepacia]MDS0847041.1 hypothetical protein [Burkholderia cenocepacia]MDS0847042.1 hypothetical protein [Burkholderia cenocepacia]